MMSDFNVFLEYPPILIPILIVDIVLKIIALIHILKNDNYRIGNRFIWVGVVLLISTFGSISYFILGKENS